MGSMRYIEITVLNTICLLAFSRQACILPLPDVPHSVSNSTDITDFPEGTVIRFSCNSGYRGSGTNIYICVNDTWTGDYECQRTCNVIRGIENGKIVNNPSYVVSSSISFDCNTGYTMNGTSSLRCRANGEWRPANPPICQLVNCGSFGYVENGQLFQENLDGAINTYGSIIHVECDSGYVLTGSPSVTCRADGTWDSQPTCTVSSCGSHPGFNSSCIYDSSLEGPVLTFLCMEGSADVSVTEVGGGIAFCDNNQWDDLEMACYCDCKVRADFTKVNAGNLDENMFLKHGQNLKWSCRTGYIKQNVGAITCRDGEVDTPKCTPTPTTTKTYEIVTRGDTRQTPTTRRLPTNATETTHHIGLPTESKTPVYVVILIGVLILVTFVVGLIIYKKKYCVTVKQKNDNQITEKNEQCPMVP